MIVNRFPSLAFARSAIAALCLIAVTAAGAGATEIVERPDLASVFRKIGVSGTFVLFDVAEDRITVFNRARAECRLVPASTFKVANSLIALETGVVADEEEIIPYGGKPQPVKSWQRDMSMRDAIKISNVPVYQELARRIGIERYRHWLAELEYGNGQVGGNVETFWLRGPLAISAVEQSRFLARLAAGKLPASADNQARVRSILRLEDGDGWVLYGKSGWALTKPQGLGWWVGWVEHEGRLFTFALNIDMNRLVDAPKRMTLGKALLAELGVF